MIFLSVAIITFNEEKNIARCIASIKEIADEIIVVDSFSTDNTKSICLAEGVKFIEQPFLGYKEQKKFALDHCQFDFVLSLDADEAVSDELMASIKVFKSKKSIADGYNFNRRSWFCNNWVYHGRWYPDKKLRLFRRNLVQITGINPHDKFDLPQNAKITYLKGDLLHYTVETLEDYKQQCNKFSTISAEHYFHSGKKASWFKILANPIFAFFSSYILHFGFLDGINGFTIAKGIANTTFMKYTKLKRLQENYKDLNFKSVKPSIQ
jgi:glycosyltransferase involved in cell wall biosynthesis